MSAWPRSAAHVAEVRALIAPTTHGDLLLPTAAVAEVVAYADEARVHKDGPGWFVGELDWRSQRVPLVDLGKAHEGMARRRDAGARRRRPCILIAISPNRNRALPYCGFLVADSPRLVRIRAADLMLDKTSKKRPLVLCALEFQGCPAWVPDLDEVERQALQLGLVKEPQS